MRATLHRIAVAVGTIAACSALAAPTAQRFIDAAHMRIADGGDAMKIALGDTATDVHLAQTITVRAGGNAVGVFLPVSCDSGSAIVRLRDRDGDFPGATVLAEGQIDPSGQPLDIDRVFTYVPFFTPAAVDAQSLLSLDVEATGGTCTFSFAPAGSDYRGGNGWFRGTSTDQTWVRLPVDLTGDDLPFELLMEQAPASAASRPQARPH